MKLTRSYKAKRLTVKDIEKFISILSAIDQCRAETGDRWHEDDSDVEWYNMIEAKERDNIPL